MSASVRRTVLPIAAIVLTVGLIGAVCRYMVVDSMRAQIFRKLRSDGGAVAELARDYYTGNDSGDFYGKIRTAAKVSGTDAVICDTSGTLLLCSDAPEGCAHQGLVLEDTEFLSRVFSGEVSFVGNIGDLYSGSRYITAIPVLYKDAPIGIVIASVPTQDSAKLLARFSYIYLEASLLAVLIAAAFIVYANCRVSKPLRQLADAARQFGHGQLDARVSVGRSAPEVRALSLAFNNMASSLQKSEERRQDFVANVSHELKTPMTTIAGMVDGMLDGTIPPQKHRHYMQMVSDETKRLSRLVRGMLDISRLQDRGGFPEEEKTRFELSECVSRVLITFEQKIEAKKLSVTADFPEHPVFTRACQDAVTQVVYNLLDNAVKFCPEDGELSIGIRVSGQKLYVSVANSGGTIPAEELPLVFERFHKQDKSRTKTAEGWGLGLYIVKTIVCGHGEDISVSSRDGRTEFVFSMPLVN